MATFDRSVARVGGPLAQYAAGFAAELVAQGYCADSIYRQLQLAAEFSCWLSEQDLAIRQLNQAALDRFVPTMRTRRRKPKSASGLAPMLRYLQSLDALPAPVALPDDERNVLLGAYQRHLRAERGVCERTVREYTPVATAFLTAVGDPLPDRLQVLTAQRVLEILKVQLRACNPPTAKQITKVARSLLRFLHSDGRIPRELGSVVPRVAHRRLAGLPARPDTATSAALLASCNRDTETGLRDYAVLLILARLGLRSSETAHLSLDDIDWRNGEITIRGKGSSVEVLPLPWDVGEAMTDYLRIRSQPYAPTRAVFLTALPPRREMTNHGLGSIVLRACRRAGVPEYGPHTLRHALASNLLAAGASLPEVGEILRHVDPRTTAIYAKVNRTALSTLVRPWPAQPARRS